MPQTFEGKKQLWITLALINLSITALLGLALRTKFLFSIPFINYRYFISAHSHFAFGGWVTLALMVLFVYYLLPRQSAEKGIFQISLWSIELSSLGMAVSFPFSGYALFSTGFSILFLFSTYVFSFAFIQSILDTQEHRVVKWLSISSLAYLVLSSAGPWILAYILFSKSYDSNLYRDAVYSFLHFQYNGFFTLAIFALAIKEVITKFRLIPEKHTFLFALYLIISIVPSLALSLLWHPDALYLQVAAGIGCVLTLLTLIYVFHLRKWFFHRGLFPTPFARILWYCALISFLIKMILQTGTIIPSLAQAVYGFRPIIIGFLHLVFLGFVSFFLLAMFLQKKHLSAEHGFTRMALIIFSTGVLLNEGFLAVQGFHLLNGSTSPIYPWLLWGAAILLFTGASLIAISRGFLSKKPPI